MKKTYSKPETTCINVRMQHMVCGSGLTGTNVEGLGYGGNSEGNVTEAGSRGGSFWDDEDY